MRKKNLKRKYNKTLDLLTELALRLESGNISFNKNPNKLLVISGKLASAARVVINSKSKDLTSYIYYMEGLLEEYDKEIFDALNYENVK